jgi:undecaprenyl-diphosphatase
MEFIIELDKEALLFFNGWHSPFWDSIMYWVSHKLFWIPLYAFLLGWLIWKEKWNAVYTLIALGLTIAIADRFTSGFMKPFFARPRPCHDAEIGSLVHLVENHCGGKWGFASSHAANVFGIASFFWIQFGKHYRAFAWLFPWALLVAYSRVYLGVHYPADITVGALVGVLAAWLATIILRWYRQRYVLTKTSV